MTAGKPAECLGAGGQPTQAPTMGPGNGMPRKVGATVWSLPVTHTDVQVLQEELQQTSAQAQRPHPLVAPRGLDPRAQVLGKMGVSHGCPGDSPGGRGLCAVGR